MKIDLTGTGINLSSRKLPSETDLENFFKAFKTPKELNARGFFEAIPTYPYSELNYRNQVNFPNIGQTLSSGPVKTEGWIVPDLQDFPEDYEIDLLANPLIKTWPPEINNLKEETHTSYRNIPSLGMLLDSNLREQIEKAPDISCLNFQTTIKNFSDLTHITHRVSSFISNFTSYQTQVFKKGLQENDYIKFDTYEEVVKKVFKLKKAYPVSQVFVIAEEPLLNYMQAHSSTEGQILERSWLLKDVYSSYSTDPTANLFNNYKSAVFVLDEMKGKHDFSVSYKLRREKRAWTVYLNIMAKLSIYMPPNPLKESDTKLERKEHDHKRWGQLF